MVGRAYVGTPKRAAFGASAEAVQPAGARKAQRIPAMLVGGQTDFFPRRRARVAESEASGAGRAGNSARAQHTRWTMLINTKAAPSPGPLFHPEPFF